MSALATKKGRTTAFTLIELLVVILIAGILAAMSVPTFNAIVKGTALRTGVKALTDTLSLGRQFAITNRYLYHVELDDELTAAETTDDIRDDYLQKHRYRIYYVDRRGKEVTVRKWRLLPEFVKYDDDLSKRPPNEIVFNPRGGAAAYDDQGNYVLGFDFKVRILHTESGTEGKEKAMTIKVNKITGRVKAEPG